MKWKNYNKKIAGIKGKMYFKLLKDNERKYKIYPHNLRLQQTLKKRYFITQFIELIL